jgi:hypothetical protein
MINEPDSFAYKTMTGRIPGIARQVLADYQGAYPAYIVQQIQAVHDELFENRAITPLETTAPDGPDWQAALQPYLGQHWLNAPWYLAESFFYRKLVEASGYFGQDEWAGRDLFLARKMEELAGEAAWAVLTSALRAGTEDTPATLGTLLHFCVWGNRIDLSYTQVIRDSSSLIAVEREEANLLVDDTTRVVTHLQQGRQATPRPDLHFICDNAGTELLTDLALADFLLRFNWIERVILHVKAHPTYVSDTTAADVAWTLTAMEARSGSDFLALAERLKGYRSQQRLQIWPDFFWTSSHFFWEIPTTLQVKLAQAHLVIIKGDANYRRLLGDSRWPTTVPAGAAVPYFPAPFVALRTLKSYPIVGLPPSLAEQLDQEDVDWRVNGQRGLIQMVG